MPISIDHEAYLGDRVELIAAEKAGIIKPGRPVIVGAQESETAQEVLIHTADRLGAPVTVYGQDFLAYEENGRLIYQDDFGLMDLTPPRLPGRHQYANAAAAIAAVKAAGFDLSHEAADRAMTSVEWPGRMQRLTQGALVDLAPRGAEIWLDGGHNPGRRRRRRRGDGRAGRAQGAAAVPDRRHDQHQGPDRLFPAPSRVSRGMSSPCRSGSSDAGVPNAELAARAADAGLSAEPVASVANALMLLRDTWDSKETPPRILIGGSLYLAGEVLAENGTPPT